MLLPVIANFAGYVTNDVYVCNNMAKNLKYDTTSLENWALTTTG